MRSIKVTYSNGEVIPTSMAEHLTDAEMLDYFKIGKSFNIGSGVNDNMQTVTKAVIVRTLSDYWQLAYNAHSNTSFSHDKRADDCIRSHSNELDSDLLGMPEDQRELYKENYIKKFTAWLSAKSRCISSMITGPANFPVRRAQKANESEHKRCSEFIEWRKWTLGAIRKRAELADRPPVDHKDSVSFPFEGGEVIVNYDLDRVQIKHFDKPLPAVIAILKKEAFKWSPKNTVWQRQLTDNGKRATCRVTGVSYDLLKAV